MSAPEQITDDALSRLEEEIIQIKGLARCLQLMGEGKYSGDSEIAFAYAGDRLLEHHDAAREAFDEIFEAMMKQRDGKGQAP